MNTGNGYFGFSIAFPKSADILILCEMSEMFADIHQFHDTEVGLVCMKKFNVLQVVLDSKGEAESSFCRTELAHQRLVLKKITIIGFSTPMGSGVELQYKFIKSPISHYFQLCFTLKM